ncbi:outer membrane protein [Methylobacterium sp. A54F]
MKKILLASTLLAGMGAAASAADLPRRAAPPPVFQPVPVFTWTGFYAGFNAGYAFGSDDSRNNNVFNPNANIQGATLVAPAGAAVAFSNSNREGFTGGGQVGYNYQFTPGSGVVIGVEADAQYLDFGGRRSRYAVVGGLPTSGNLTFIDPRGATGLDFFGTVRGRIGYAFDRVMVYGTGGFAYGSGDSDRYAGLARNDDFRTGWAAGGGIEYALPTDSFLNFFRSSAVTLKVEGLYVNLDRSNRNQGLIAANAATGATYNLANFALGRRDDDFAVVRAGINYKFGSY